MSAGLLQRHRPTQITIRTPDDAAPLGTVLGIWAHPDDETYLSGALMALARQARARVVCVTATFGEHGTSEPGLWPPQRLAPVRRMELATALATLGVAELRWLGFEDGTLENVGDGVGAVTIASVIDEVAPETIVTFGPDGITGHPDHRAVARWVRDAMAVSGSNARVLHATTMPNFVDEFADIHEAMPVFGEGLPRRTRHDEIDVVVRLDDAMADLKLAALRAHHSQVEPLIAVIGEERLRAWWRTEAFRRVEPSELVNWRKR